ncbi:MAG: DNA-directed RNA polymerase subunit alpha [Patescibacteria group bacterium]|nr:DNA-directed RNA polymerase subunit alpha [Patescibacteria group bacterium]MDD5490499.1 DNA-directed RNA polymerase subunit alpha [Patescibacteria group bacterium]
MENIILPSQVEITKSKEENKAIFTISPCYFGYGLTLGNALRRVLLSSLPGAAVTSFKVKGVDHEFSAIPHVLEDVIEIILNLKQLRLKVFSEEPVKLNLKVKGEKEVTADDISKSSDVEIINKNLHIATLTDKDAELDMEITVSQGRGYITTEMRDRKNLEIGEIAIDSIFSPAKNVGFKTENVRVGQITNYDKLILEVVTDGTISPEEAFKQSVQILLNHFNLLMDLVNENKSKKKASADKGEIKEENSDDKGEEEKNEKKETKKKAVKKTAKAKK